VRSQARLDGVDLLRGAAIFFVLMNHVNMRLFLIKLPYTASLPEQVASSLVWNGQYGVQMFFAVSGFLITSTSLVRWGRLSNVDVRAFYLLRFARIGPLLLTLLAILSVLHIVGFSDYKVAQSTGGLGRALVAALTFHINLLEARRGYLPGSWDVLWSLSVEEMFYLFFPVVCWALGRGKLLYVLLAVLIVIGPFGRTSFADGNEIWQEVSYLGGMDAIAMGCVTALITAHSGFSAGSPRIMSAVGATLLVLILGFSKQAELWGLVKNGLDMSALAFGTCLLIAAAAQTRWRSPWMLRPLATLGRCSYEIYLLHMFVVFALFNFFMARGGHVGEVPALFAGVIVVAALLGAATSRFYSEPLNRLLRSRWS
jgi:peptidoglycan/LPS O-acetylase OafA/YrhL